MTTPITGAISMGQMRNEAGLSGQINMGNARLRRMMMRPGYFAGGDGYISQPPRMSDARATRYIPDGATWTNLNLRAEFSYTGAQNITFKLIIPPGSQVGGNTNGWAMAVSDGWPIGSNLNIVNWGNILGGYGQIGQGSNGGYGQTGGGCIYAPYPNVWTSLYNKPGGQVFSGGGGGGKGGTGGRGGRGGNGYYVATSSEGPTWDDNSTGIYRFTTGSTYWKWHADGVTYQNNFSTAGDGTNQVNVGADRFYRGDLVATRYDFVSGYYNVYTITKQYDYNVYTYGGGGGWGGGGGDGGYGQGFDHGQTGPTNGGRAGGTSGTPPNGNNAGWGGWGGAGGQGGWGGGWGANGAAGNTGDRGADGGWGNIEGVIGGEWGAGGVPGGPSGFSMYIGGRGGISNEGDLRGRIQY